MSPWILSGAGNTFLIEILESTDDKPVDQQIKKLCEKHQVDGYLGLERIVSDQKIFQWNFFNNDGSKAEFCGNAARCAQFYLHEVLKKNEARHITLSGEVQTYFDQGSQWVQMPKAEIYKTQQELSVNDKSYQGLWCDTGVPHFVIKSSSARPDRELSKALRFHKDLGPRGANITWILPQQEPETVEAVTYERGVENFTQACGTGALAAALWAKENQKQKDEFKIKMPGGRLLVRKKEAIWVMTGPVEKVGEWQGSKI